MPFERTAALGFAAVRILGSGRPLAPKAVIQVEARKCRVLPLLGDISPGPGPLEFDQDAAWFFGFIPCLYKQPEELRFL